MTTTEAKDLLLLHGFAKTDDDDHMRRERGFLASLRPYRGHLVEDSFHEVMAAMRVLAPSLQQPEVDTEIVHALWGICYLARLWGIHPEGMLRRNRLITAEDVQRLEQWVDCISYATFVLTGSKPGRESSTEAFHKYDTQFARRSGGTNDASAPR